MLELKIVDVNVVVEEVSRMLLRTIGEDIRQIRLLRPDLWSVRADPGQLGQVIMNLAVNARDAMPKGGKLVIETDNVEVDEAYVAGHPEMTVGSYVQLAVSDTGCGMDQATLAHVFQPFFTTKEQGKGTGLGLATVFGIVKQCGGHVWVYSEPGRGTTFRIFLPRLTEGVGEADRPKA
ncbi:MAG: ATP-binding protein, partial [bacterium]